MVLNLNHKEKMQEDDIGLTNCVHMTATRLIKCVPIVVTTHVETIVLLSHKSPDSVINVKVEFGKGKGKVPLVEDVCSRTVSEAELSHLLDYLLDLACDEKILELYKRVCRSIYIYISRLY